MVVSRKFRTFVWVALIFVSLMMIYSTREAGVWGWDENGPRTSSSEAQTQVPAVSGSSQLGHLLCLCRDRLASSCLGICVFPIWCLIYALVSPSVKASGCAGGLVSWDRFVKKAEGLWTKEFSPVITGSHSCCLAELFAECGLIVESAFHRNFW